MVDNTENESPGRNTKRSESGVYASQYSTETIIETLESDDVVGTQDVADALGCVYDTAYKRLRKLEDEGRVQSQKVANTRIWELADAGEDNPDADSETQHENESGTFGRGDGTTLDAEDGDTLPQSGTRQEVVPDE
jgi:hypothetical protein